MISKTRILNLALLVLFVVACDSKEEGPSPTGIKYLNDVVDIMEENSLHRNTIDWTKFRSDVIAAAEKADTDEKINNALRTALTALGDRHSYIERNGVFLNGNNAAVCTGSLPGDVDVPSNIGYIHIPTVIGSNDQVAIDLQNKIKDQDNEEIIGWIVDLRGNGGGNMWPMLAGVGPILGEGTAGYFISPDENSDSYEYKTGSSAYNGTDVTTVPSPYTLINSMPKVAVLTNNATASSGEAIAVAFLGRPNTRSFGAPTCGVSTANGNYKLPDGWLYLTVAVMADRNKNKEGGQIEPDEPVSGATQVVERAIEWLNEP